jgi:hypothetical protein
MKQGKFFAAGMLALAFGVISAGCDNEIDPDPFIAVTGIADVPTIAIKGEALTLRGIVTPSNATNKTISWSGGGVSNGKLTVITAASFPATVTVTATIVNGASESSAYSRNFNIKVYDTGTSGGANPFGTDGSPNIWAMDNAGGYVYVTLKDTTWEATVKGVPYNSGNYTRIGASGAQWKVTGGPYGGDTGLAIIDTDGKIIVANFWNELSAMNGMFTKLNTGLSLEGTWKSSGPYYDGKYRKIAAESSGNFIVSLSPDNAGWTEALKGTYQKDTNPAACTITSVNTKIFSGAGDNWVAWSSLTEGQKKAVNYTGSNIITVIIYDDNNDNNADRCELLGLTCSKQP